MKMLVFLAYFRFSLYLYTYKRAGYGHIKSITRHDGRDGYIIAEKDNVLLICKKEDSSALVRKYVNEVQIKKGDEFV